MLSRNPQLTGVGTTIFRKPKLGSSWKDFICDCCYLFILYNSFFFTNNCVSLYYIYRVEVLEMINLNLYPIVLVKIYIFCDWLLWINKMLKLGGYNCKFIWSFNFKIGMICKKLLGYQVDTF